MLPGNRADRYGPAAKTLHWLTVVLLLASFGIGLTMVDMPLSPEKLRAFSWHKWVGVTVLLVTVLRLCWRLADPPPPLPATMPRWQRAGAQASHMALYAVLIVMPLSGWTMSSALGLQTVYLGLVPLPDLVAPDPGLGALLTHLHHALALGLVLLIGVHVAAALYHHLVLRDGVLRRMLPFAVPREGGPR